jgi:hypothetical protein
MIDERRAQLLADGEIKRSLDGEDIEWAQEHAEFPDTGETSS